MRCFLFTFTLSILFIESCSIEGYPGKCEIHHKGLHKSIVQIKYGFCCPKGTHLGKGSETFPNAKHPICGGCVVRKHFKLMYNCSKCNRVKRKYERKNKDELKVRAIF